MSEVTKFYYTTPVVTGKMSFNPIEDVTAVSHIKIGRRHTIAAVYDDEKKTISFGLSTCQPCDNFCKSIGREIATKNAKTKPFYVITGFSGRRNDYADEVLEIMIKTEEKLLKKDHPDAFNKKNYMQ